MMNQIQRLITLANDIEIIRPGRDPLRILFLKACLESLIHLANMEKRKDIFYNEFPNFFSKEGEEYILNSFRLLGFQDMYSWYQMEVAYDLTLSDFLEIMKVVRDMVVHDGNYWKMQFFARDQDSTWLASIETDAKILKHYIYKTDKKQKRMYSFETTMIYDRFIHYFTEACVNYLREYIDRRII